MNHAEHIVPLLRRIEQRGRGADVLPLYLHALVTEHGDAATWARLRSSTGHDLRGAAFRHSFESELLGLQEAVVLLPRERDQVVRRQMISVIADSATPDVLAQVLLRSRFAEGRVEGLVKLAAAELDPVDVERLVVDRSILVRLWARRRWREMGNDPVTTYGALAGFTAEPTVRAGAFIGLAETGAAVGHEETLVLVRSTELPLRKAGLALLTGNATGEDVPLLLSLVAGDHRRVARLASEGFARSPQAWSLSDLSPLKAADDPELRRRAWWIHRHLGGWEAVVADLEVLNDPDPQLAALGRQPAAPMYQQPTDSQRQRLTSLLTTAPLDRDQLLAIAIAAGLPGPARTLHARNPEPIPDSQATAVEQPRRPWWRFWKRPSNR